MPERSLDVVISRDGIDTVMQSFSIADKDTVKLHQPDEDHFRAVIRHPRTAYDKIEREVIPGEPEVVLVASGADASDAAAPSATPTEAPATEEKPVRRSRTTKRTTKKSTAKKK